MKLSDKEKIWIKVNREELENFFRKRIEALKEEVFLIKTSEIRDRKIDFIHEYEKCLYLIKIFTTDDLKFNRNYI